MQKVDHRTGKTGSSRRRNRYGKYGWRLTMVGVLLVLTLLAAATAPAQDVEHGKIDSVRPNGLVIDDMYVRFDPTILFFENANRDTFANPQQFTAGKKVGYELNDKNLLTAIWFE